MSDDRRQQGTPPTPETVAKAHPIIIHRLHTAGKLSLRQVHAAFNIRKARYAVMHPAAFPSRDISTGPAPKGIGPRSEHPFAALPEGHYMKDALKTWERRTAVKLGSAILRVLVLAIVEANCGLRTVEKALHIRHGTAILGLVTGLDAWPCQENH